MAVERNNFALNLAGFLKHILFVLGRRNHQGERQ
jgi:hypothetical protein